MKINEMNRYLCFVIMRFNYWESNAIIILKQLYDGPQTDAETCKFHPGVPIFHEGLKYWSCCQKKTTEFDVFMKQEGCQTGSHVWVKPKEASEFEGGPKVMKCRHDWHQDGSFVHVVIYGGGKKFDPSKSHVQAHGIKLNVELSFPEEHSLYKETWILAGVSFTLIFPQLSVINKRDIARFV